ncbi:MAG: NACHT domain-containing protein [Nostoc sp.]|uniref:NACHT domain-containing protein n=1 Tax=Nostoc sp. TaxID=1180 RepID=UPI002FF6FA14
MTGMEPWAISAVSGVAAIFFQISSQVLGVLGKTLDENTQKLIFNASNQYQKNYEERHGILKVLGMREPVKLESLYTSVQFLDDDAIQSFESIENLENFYRQAKSRRFQSQETPKQEGIKVANDKQYLMVLGGPGAGKSTFVRKMGLEALKDKKGGFKHGCIPVFIELKRFASSNINIERFIAEEFGICGFPSPDKFAVKTLEEGKLLILLDGLDEVPTKNLTEAISQIQNFVDKYDKNRFIASCRTAAYRSRFRRFSDVSMADFDDTQIQQFIYNWFHCEADEQAKTGEKCWELLQKPEHKAAKELAHTPLLLTFLCLVYDRSQSFPDNRSVLYRKALRILLEEWASEKRILRDEIYQGLHTELEEILLSDIAYTGFESDRLFFSQRDIVQQIKTFLASNLNAPQHLDGQAVLNAIAIQQGILVQRAEDVFSFSHLTLQEYLTAQYIDDHRQVEKLVTEHLTDQRWKEVFLLVAGLMRGGADDLLLLMEKEAQKYINTPKLKALINWAEQVTAGSEGNYKPVGKRASAIAIAYAITFPKKAITIGIAKAYAIATTYAIRYADAYADDFDIYAIAYDDAHVHAIATRTTIPISDSHFYIYTISILNTVSIANTIIHELEKLKIFIFNKVHFTLLIARLKALQTKMSDYKQPLEADQAFFESIQQTWLNAFNLTQEMVNLSKEEAEALRDYLYANYLIIQCKQAAVRVLPQTWEAIEARMLLVPGG